MTSLAERAGVHDAARAAACTRLLERLRAEGIVAVRVGWCDLHGALRGKTLMPEALPAALAEGVGLVSTLLLKDTSDRTAFKVFEPGLGQQLPGFAFAGNLLLLPDPDSCVTLPWAPGTAWLRGELFFDDGRPVGVDPRRALQAAVQRLAGQGWQLRTGLEVEFHVYRVVAERLDPDAAAWPGEPPQVELVHPGYNLLAEAWADRSHAVLDIVRRTALGLGLPLRSLEIELGPSQFEAVFDAADALTTADRMVLFRNGVRQALQRAGYHATFMCRPPFASIMSSGWHLHQSLVDGASGRNLFMREAPAPVPEGDARAILSDLGARWLAGLLEHASAGAVFGCSTVNAFGRFRPNALAPMAARWGRDNRGAMLRVLGRPGDAASRIENRIGEPMANPYLYLASQIHAGLDGVHQGRMPPPATEAPYAEGGGGALPMSLEVALDALEASTVFAQAFDGDLLQVLLRIKRSEAERHAQAEDKVDWARREYFSRY
ncbi:MAG: glutamine synthetase [Rubrivivax sp.]|nr:glutamine synthetase [Rubrivivax sp.]